MSSQREQFQLQTLLKCSAEIVSAHPTFNQLPGAWAAGPPILMLSRSIDFKVEIRCQHFLPTIPDVGRCGCTAIRTFPPAFSHSIFGSVQPIPYLRIYGWNCVFPSVGQHGTLCVGVLHLHHKTSWNSCAFFNSGNRLEIFVLLRNADISQGPYWKWDFNDYFKYKGFNPLLLPSMLD